MKILLNKLLSCKVLMNLMQQLSATKKKNSLGKCFETFKRAAAPGFAVGTRVSGMSLYTIDGTRTIIFPQLLIACDSDSH